MRWIGILVGGYVGSLLRLGSFGVLIGMAVGYWLEGRFRGKGGANGRRGRASARDREIVFCATAAAMLAKMAKADGRVTRSEIDAVEAAFARLGFTAYAREYAVNVFRRAKDDDRTIYSYAREFASAVTSIEVRELFYGMLWDLACADGEVDRAELEILRQIPSALGISPRWFSLYDAERRRAGRGGSSQGSSSGYRPPPRTDSLEAAYAELGVASSASNDEVKRAYRERAKRFHPDVLRAQGLPEEMMAKATERMSRLNEAWATVRAARGI